MPATPPDRSLRTAVVWDSLQELLAGADGPLDVLDVGGGTGGFAVPLAERGHHVTVVDPSPDALASLQRRTGEVGAAVTALQGDAAGLLDVVRAGSADLVLCHGVLEHVEEVGPALAALASVLRPGGTLSLLAAQRGAAVLSRALAGRFAEAAHVLADPDGRWGPGDPLPRRFSADDLVDAVVAAGLTVREVHGTRTLVDHVPGAVLDQEPGAAEALLGLERALAGEAGFRSLATQLHVIATAG